MLEQSALRVRFQELLAGERQAEKLYAELAAGTADPAVKEQVHQLLRDKRRHIRLAERLLELVE